MIVKTMRILMTVMLCIIALRSSVQADNISKTFEFGPGTTVSRSVFKTFPLPCGTETGVAAVVKFQRQRSTDSFGDISIVIELREPDTAPDQEGAIVETKTATATTSEQTLVLRSSQSSNRGCSLPWRVRVRHALDGPAPIRVFGTIRLDYDGRSREVTSNSVGSLPKGQSKTVNLGDVSGLDQGTIEITANWQHLVFGVTYGPLPVKLRFELINPSGSTVKTVEAYSSDELRSELTRFKLTHRVALCTPGQWKLKVTNVDQHDAEVGSRKATFTPGCPN